MPIIPGRICSLFLYPFSFDEFLRFMLIGGMPKVVAIYSIGGSLLQCQQALDDLTISLYDDFSKYKERVPSSRLREVFSSIIQQTGGKFTFSKALPIVPLEVKSRYKRLHAKHVSIPFSKAICVWYPLLNGKFRHIPECENISALWRLEDWFMI